VGSHYAGRWSIEVTFRDAKQCLGGENPQCWRHQGPERAAAMSLWLMSAVWVWYIPTFGTTTTWLRRAWYPAKTTPSFLDALAALRRVLWRNRITAVSSSTAGRLTKKSGNFLCRRALVRLVSPAKRLGGVVRG
jgi:hypothetical protein